MLTLYCKRNPLNPETNAKQNGKIFIDSSPPQAEIWLDNKNTGYLTPDTLKKVSVGLHTLTLKKTKYYDWTTQVTVEEGVTTLIFAVLDGEPGRISVSSQPSGADIWLDGKFTGHQTPYILENIPIGNHTLELFLKGYFPWSKSFYLNSQETKVFNPVIITRPDYLLFYNRLDTLIMIKTRDLDPHNPDEYVLATDYRPVNGTIKISPNGQYLAYTVNEGIKIINLQGMTISFLKFSSQKRATDFTWSHNSRYLVVGCYTNGIYRLDMQTLNLELIIWPTTFAYCHNPVYSPNDINLVFIYHTWGDIATLYVEQPNATIKLGRIKYTHYDEKLDLGWLSNNEILAKCSRTKGLYYSRFDNDGVQVFEKVIDTEISHLFVSPFGKYFVFTNKYGIHSGVNGQWTTKRIVNYQSVYDLSWAADNTAFAFRSKDGIHWFSFINNSDYHIIHFSASTGGVAIIKN